MGNAWPDTKLNPDTEDKLIDLLTEGQHVKTACALVGIAPQTYYNWVNKGIRGDSAYAGFSRRALEAREKATQKSVKAIIEAGDKDWRAHAWYLERSRPNMYGATERHRHEIEARTLSSLFDLASGKVPNSTNEQDE